MPGSAPAEGVTDAGRKGEQAEDERVEEDEDEDGVVLEVRVENASVEDGAERIIANPQDDGEAGGDDEKVARPAFEHPEAGADGNEINGEDRQDDGNQGRRGQVVASHDIREEFNAGCRSEPLIRSHEEIDEDEQEDGRTRPFIDCNRGDCGRTFLTGDHGRGP